MPKYLKILIIFLLVVLVLLVGVVFYLFVGNTKPAKNITWGVDFSQSQAEYLKLDWKQTYLAILEDLGAKNIKLHTNWNWVEGKQNNFYFNDIDWQIKQAESHQAKIIYVIGMKTGRWPECHMPNWSQNLSEERQQAELLKYITEVVLRYKDSKAILYWQVENEPLFRFGECPGWYYNNDKFLTEEIRVIKALDSSRKIIVSDSGEQSNWFTAGKDGDIVGITMYRNAWTNVANTFGFEAYSFLNPAFYANKAQIIKKVYNKKVICIELQAEPWAAEPLLQAPLSEQLNSMNPKMFLENVDFAQKTGFDTFYFWGTEWWYWLKTTQNQPGIWNEAKKLFK